MKTAAPKVKHQNVTLSLPVSLLRQFKVYAAENNQSMSRLAAAAIRKMVGENDEYERARQRILDSLKNPKGRGIGEKIPWTRDQLYEEMLSERSKGSE